MSTYAQVENGMVITRIEADAEFVAELEGNWVHDSRQDMVVGWAWDGKKCIAPVSEPIPITPSDVDAERDRRMAQPIELAGSVFQVDASIFEAFTVASIDPDAMFTRILLDNSILVMNATETLSLGCAVIDRKSKLAIAARKLKDRNTIPQSYQSDAYWLT